MYKHFQGGNAKIICDRLNESGMKIHSIEQTNGIFHCVAEKSDDKRELRALGGSVLQVTKNLNIYGRQIEGKVLMRGHAATAFYRYDEEMEKQMQAKISKKEREAEEARIAEEKEAKKAEMKKKMEELKKQMESVDSELSDSQKEEAEKAAKEEAAEMKRKEQLKKDEEKRAKLEAEAKAKKESSDMVKKEAKKKVK